MPPPSGAFDVETLSQHRAKTMFFLKALGLFALICVPGNIVAFALYFGWWQSRDDGEYDASCGAGFNESSPATLRDSTCAEEKHFKCYELLSEHGPLLQDFNLYTHGYAIAVTGCLGLLGNALTLVVLPKLDAHYNFHKLLMSLAVVDIVVIAIFLFDLRNRSNESFLVYQRSASRLGDHSSSIKLLPAAQCKARHFLTHLKRFDFSHLLSQSSGGNTLRPSILLSLV